MDSWAQATDSEGRAYWHNVDTAESSWERPVPKGLPEPPPRDAPLLERMRYYYVHFELPEPASIEGLAAQFEENATQLNEALNNKYMHCACL